MQERTQSYLQFLVAVASLVIIIAGMRAIASVLNPVLMALLILFISLPLVRWLEAKGMRHGLAVGLTCLVVLLVIAGVVLLIGSSLVQLLAGLPAYQATFDEKVASWQSSLGPDGIDVTDALAAVGINGGQIIQLISTLIGGIVSALSSIGFVIMYFVFMTVEASGFSEKMRKGLGPHPALEQARRFTKSVSDFMMIKAWLGFLAAAGDVILLLVLGVDYALLWGVLSFLLSFIPSIGYILALIPPVLVAFIQYGPTTALIVFFGYWLINGMIDSVIGPHFLGQGLDLSTVVTIIAAFFWAWVLGPVGAFLALPITIAIKMLILEHYPETRWVALALANEGDAVVATPPPAPAPHVNT